MILNAIAEKLKRQSKHDFKGRHFEAWLIVQAVAWYLRYPLSYRDIEEMFGERGFVSITAQLIGGYWPTRR
ncbi:transposase-like protein [Rhizobium leguminosarum]